MAAPAPAQRNAPIRADHSTVVMSGLVPSTNGTTRAQSSTPTATTRPTQPAAMVPLLRLPVTAQTSDSRICPPSSGRPGSRLNRPTKALENAPAQSRSAGTVMTGEAWKANQNPAASARLVSGPTTATRKPSSGRPRPPV